MVIRGKGGFLRIVEAFIGVLIVASVLIFIYVNHFQRPSESERIYKLETFILEKISEDPVLRQIILDSNHSKDQSSSAVSNRSIINNTIRSLLPEEYNFEFMVCELNEVCGLEHDSRYYTENEIYGSEKSVSSTLSEYKPRKLRIFVWIKE